MANYAESADLHLATGLLHTPPRTHFDFHLDPPKYGSPQE